MKVVLLLVSGVALIGGYLSFGREYDVAYLSRSPEFEIFEDFSSDAEVIRLPFSARGMRELFSVCGGLQQGIIYALQPSEVQQVISGKCLALSAQALVKNPTYAAAHTIKMMSVTTPPEIRAAMVVSQATSAYESWDAKLRLAKTISLAGTGDAAFNAALRADIVFLVQTDGGRTWLANLYNRTPNAQDILTQTIETRPTAEKSAFLQKVRAGG